MDRSVLSLSDILKIEPRIGDLIEACASIPDGVCMNDAWYTDDFKGTLVKLVGWGAGDARLKTAEAYDVAYQACIGAFPSCGNGRCYRCGKPLPERLSFDGIHPGGRKPQFASANLSWIAALDMLGYSRRVLEADEEGRTDNVLTDLRRIVAETYPFLGGDPTSWRVKAYTDNVLVNVPIEGSAHSEFDWLCSSLARFQTAMLFHGQAIRGGLSFGQSYVDDDIAYGAGLIEAHALEGFVAKTPRIVISPRTRRFVAFFLARVAEATGLSWAAHSAPLMIDEDGWWFIDYLAPITGRSGEPFDPVALERHRDVVIHLLQRFASDDKVLEKYKWVARYHDSVCLRMHKNHFAITEELPDYPRPLSENDLTYEIKAFLDDSGGSLDLLESAALQLVTDRVQPFRS